MPFSAAGMGVWARGRRWRPLAPLHFCRALAFAQDPARRMPSRNRKSSNRDSQVWPLSREDFAKPALPHGVQCRRRALRCVPGCPNRSAHHRSPAFRRCGPYPSRRGYGERKINDVLYLVRAEQTECFKNLRVLLFCHIQGKERRHSVQVITM
jgi:hypothetical protein